jgi:hypothetical protein
MMENNQPPGRHSARRDDDVDRWLKRWRDVQGDPAEHAYDPFWGLLDQMLDDYRLHADTGTPLDAEVSERG